GLRDREARRACARSRSSERARRHELSARGRGGNPLHVETLPGAKRRNHVASETVDLLLSLGPPRHHELEAEVRDADAPKPVDRLAQLLRRAGELAFLLSDRLAGHLDRQAAVQADAIRVAPRLARRAPYVLEPSRELRRRDAHEVREPSVPVPPGTPLGGPALTTHPDRDARSLERLREERDVLEAMVLPLEGAPVVVPQGVEQSQLLVRPLEALREGDLQRFELLHHPAGADAENEAAARQMVDRGDGLGPVERGPVGEHEHAHAEPDASRAAREVREAGERLEERPVGRDDELAARAVAVWSADLPGDDQAVGGPHRVEAELLGTPCRVGEDGRGRAARDRKKDAELHRLVPPPRE